MARRCDLHVASQDNTVFRMRQLNVDCTIRKVKERLLRSLQEQQPAESWHLDKMVLMSPLQGVLRDEDTVAESGLAMAGHATIFTTDQYRTLERGSFSPHPAPALDPGLPRSPPPDRASAEPSPALHSPRRAPPPVELDPVTASVTLAPELQHRCDGVTEFKLTGLHPTRSTWARIKRLVAPHTGMPASRHVVWFAGVVQPDEASLAASGVRSDFECELSDTAAHLSRPSAPRVPRRVPVSPDGHVALCINSQLDGREYRLPMLAPTTDLVRVRDLLERASGIPAGAQKLMAPDGSEAPSDGTTIAQVIAAADGPPHLLLVDPRHMPEPEPAVVYPQSADGRGQRTAAPAAPPPQPAGPPVQLDEDPPPPIAAAAAPPQPAHADWGGAAATSPQPAPAGSLAVASDVYTPSSRYPEPPPPKPPGAADVRSLRQRDTHLLYSEEVARQRASDQTVAAMEYARARLGYPDAGPPYAPEPELSREVAELVAGSAAHRRSRDQQPLEFEGVSREVQELVAGSAAHRRGEADFRPEGRVERRSWTPDTLPNVDRSAVADAQRELEEERERFREALARQQHRAEVAQSDSIRAHLQALERVAADVHTTLAEVKDQQRQQQVQAAAMQSATAEQIEALRVERERLERARQELTEAEQKAARNNRAEKLRVTVYPPGEVPRSWPPPLATSPAAKSPAPSPAPPVRRTPKPADPEPVKAVQATGEPPVWHQEQGRPSQPLPRRRVGTPAPQPSACSRPASDPASQRRPLSPRRSPSAPSRDVSPQRLALDLSVSEEVSQLSSMRSGHRAGHARREPLLLDPEAEAERRTERRMEAAREADLLARRYRAAPKYVEFDEDTIPGSDLGSDADVVRPYRSVSSRLRRSASPRTASPASAMDGPYSSAAAVRRPEYPGLSRRV